MHQLADHGLVNRSSPNQPRWNPILRPYKRHKAEVTSRAVNAPLEKYKPDWAGDDALSKFVNAAISFKPLYKLMKIMAKKVITQTAEKEGLPWRKHVKELAGIQEIYDIKEELEDDSIEYPSYYLQAFHAYDKGNLDWTAAFEAEMATLVIGSRTFKDSNMTVYEAQDKLRDAIAKNLQDYLKENLTPSPDQILDVGCSVGVSSRYLAKQFPEATILGLDLSPYFIAVAEYQEREMERSSEESRNRIQYKHGLGESTGLPSESFDLVQIGFVIHECRPFAIENLIKEAFRLLRPGGSILLFDNNPRSKTIQNLPPALFTLMKSTEPWSDEYYMMDVEAALERTGFRNIETKESDHRHRTIMGLKL